MLHPLDSGSHAAFGEMWHCSHINKPGFFGTVDSHRAIASTHGSPLHSRNTIPSMLLGTRTFHAPLTPKTFLFIHTAFTLSGVLQCPIPLTHPQALHHSSHLSYLSYHPSPKTFYPSRHHRPAPHAQSTKSNIHIRPAPYL